ncbi:MAG: DUF4435 domain-containing protein [Duncaniella sp.]|nr:DUF4435 domain-containing protein [Duncaniella sp.]
MILTLPRRIGGDPLEIDLDRNHQIVIIGANGAGKTRFAMKMAESLGVRAFRISALKALYATDREDPCPTSIDATYHRAVSRMPLLRHDLKGEFDRMVALLLGEEMLRLLDTKYADDSKPASRRLPTNLDRTLRRWRSVFPGNRVLIEGGRLLFSRPAGQDDEASENYSPTKLSDGEKAVLYYLGATSLAPKNSVIFVDSPSMFLHPSTTRALWDKIEQSRRDCTFVYTTHDLQFATSRANSATIWVKDCNPVTSEWDYELLPTPEGLSEEAYMAILGARKPVLFIEGDGIHSLDAKLYPLIFDDFTVSSLGGCDRVIESTRTFNSLRSFHNLAATGIVDRDRRDEGEVEYLRKKNVMVPDVAEIENIFMVEDVIRAVASHFGRNPGAAFSKVSRTVIRLFQADLRQQALQHTRHRMKRLVEHRIDGRFATINSLVEHIDSLAETLNPRGMYETLCNDFERYVSEGDYASILRVYNRKSILSESHVARACGLRHDDKDAYVRAILEILKENGETASEIRRAIRRTFSLE